MELSVIMPMYNSEDILVNLKEAIKSLEKITKKYEIIVVDDGSTNNCFEEAKKLKHKKVRIVGYKKNHGKGYAIRYGFKFAKGHFIGFIDSGRDLDPFQLKDFLKRMDKSNADVVVGSKRHEDSQVDYPGIRKFMSKGYQLINKILFNLETKDTQVGIKLYKRKVLEKIIPKVAVKRFAFDLEFLVLARKYKFKIIEAPIIMRYKFGSTINVSAVFRVFLDTLAIFYRLKILKYYDKK